MPAPYNTVLLDIQTWDLVVDAFANIAVASNPYSVAQDVASAIRTFQGEAWFDTTLGIPFFADVFSSTQPLSLTKTQISAAAETVPYVKTAEVFISSFNGRDLVGQVQIIDQSGIIQAVTL